jgi:hypothetical protein
VKDREEEWQELCKLEAIEQDPKNLLKLTSRIGELLEEKRKGDYGDCVRATAHGTKSAFFKSHTPSACLSQEPSC